MCMLWYSFQNQNHKIMPFHAYTVYPNHLVSYESNLVTTSQDSVHNSLFWETSGHHIFFALFWDFICVQNCFGLNRLDPKTIIVFMLSAIIEYGSYD